MPLILAFAFGLLSFLKTANLLTGLVTGAKKLDHTTPVVACPPVYHD